MAPLAQVFKDGGSKPPTAADVALVFTPIALQHLLGVPVGPGHSPPTPIWATEVGSFFASIWPDTVVVAHYFEQIFAYFEKKKCVFGGEMTTLSLKSSAPKSGFDTYLQ
jgi:hypothetical protein